MPKKEIKRIGVLTGGGDCPGLNAVIRAVVKSAFNLGWEVIGVREGFEGLLDLSKIEKIGPANIRGILNLGGTILGTTNRGNPFISKKKVGDSIEEYDSSDEVVKNFKQLGLDALVAIGGDGTLGIACKFVDKGIPIVGVPKTIDNDLSSTVITFGFDTAVSNATDALDKLHSTAESHRRVMVVETMGRYAGWIALNSGVSGGADVILIPEIPFEIDKVCQAVEKRYKNNTNFAIVVVAEGAKLKGGDMFVKQAKEAGKEHPVLGGISDWVSKEIEKRTGHESRSLSLGHLQRGGHPTTFDRLLATRFGACAVRFIKEGKFGVMVASIPPGMEAVPLKEAISKMKNVPVDCDTITSARQLGISFGD
ncbi:MAG: 6-phosphofructokinase [Elusimicrobia bacterium]|nr:6-phosphofructokinase [Candidatus Liberimonas magnetica]